MADLVKKCSRCGVEYLATIEFFNRNKRSCDGLTSQCKSCRREMWKEQYQKNREYHISRATAQTKKRRQDFGYSEKERDYAREKKRQRLSDPVERDKHRIRTREWFRANRQRVNDLPSRNKAIRAHYTSLYHAAQLRATPPWADLKKIADLYRLAKDLTDRTGEPHEVDHIVPLRHRLASGLHVHENLRVVTRFENRSKSNRFISIEE